MSRVLFDWIAPMKCHTATVAKRIDFRQRVARVIRQFRDSQDAARSISPIASSMQQAIGRATGSLCGLRNAQLDGGDVVADRVHGGCVNGVAV
jgi:hypothetical protein